MTDHLTVPEVADLTFTLTALERLGPRPVEPSDEAPTPDPDHRTVLRRPARTWRNR